MASGSLSGAGTGASIGGLFGGPVGAGIGAGAGAILGSIMGGNSERKRHQAINDAITSLDEAKGYIDTANQKNTALANQGLTLAGSIWDPNGTLVGNYQNALGEVDNLQGYDADNLFGYDKTIQDFYDPAIKLSVDMANGAIDNSQAFGGNFFSSDTANKLAAKNNVLATQMYNDARDAMNADKGLEQSIWAGNEAAKQAAASSKADIANTKLGAYGTGMSNLSNAQQGYLAKLMDINSNYASDMTDYLGSRANLKAQDPGASSIWSNILDPLGLFG